MDGSVVIRLYVYVNLEREIEILFLIPDQASGKKFACGARSISRGFLWQSKVEHFFSLICVCVYRVSFHPHYYYVHMYFDRDASVHKWGLRKRGYRMSKSSSVTQWEQRPPPSKRIHGKPVITNHLGEVKNSV